MKTLTSILIFCLAGLYALQAQNLNRVTLSSGGISNEGISATIGEIRIENHQSFLH